MAEAEDNSPKEQIKIYGNDRLTDRVKLFQQKAEKSQAKQKTNPFSSQFDKDAATSTGFSKDDPRYGRPPEGSKTELRGKKAHSHISKEVMELCRLISECGEHQEDGSVLISFGELFQMYTVISNKLVGMLIRGRKHGLLHFEGEMLFQRRDDDVVITLFPPTDDDDE